MSVADKLLQIDQVKQDIKVAIENKDVDLTGVEFGGYAGKIDEIQLPKEEETKTVTPNFASGNVVVTPDTDKVLTQVTVVKDNDLVPENIVKDVNIFGVVGTAETGGGASGGYNVKVNQSGGGATIEMLVKFSDGKGLLVDFPYNLPNTYDSDIELKNVVWLRVLSYEFTWALSTGITEAQAKNAQGYTLTQDVEIYIED